MSSSQVLMWWTGSSTMLKGSQIAGKHENMPATCWKLATFDTPSTRSRFLNSATMSLETSVAVSRNFLVIKNLLAVKANFKVMFPVTFTVSCRVLWLLFLYLTNVAQKYRTVKSDFCSIFVRYDPPVPTWPWWLQWGRLRSGHCPSVAPPRGSSLAYGPSLSVSYSPSLRPAAAFPWRTRCWQRREPAQWWVYLCHTSFHLFI